LPDDETVQRPPDALTPVRPKFEEPSAHRPEVRHPHVGAVLHDQFHQPRVVRQNADGPSLDLVEHALVVVVDGVRHTQMLA